MTGKEFVHILIEDGPFREGIPAYLSDNPITCNRIPSHIKFKYPGSYSFDIELNYTPKFESKYRRTDINWQGGITVDFYWGVNNLFASYKLSDLTIMDLIKELDKFLSNNSKYIEWKKCNLREYILESFLD